MCLANERRNQNIRGHRSKFTAHRPKRINSSAASIGSDGSEHGVNQSKHSNSVDSDSRNKPSSLNGSRRIYPVSTVPSKVYEDDEDEIDELELEKLAEYS
jgi:hypothetical protein